ncbi:MAG: FAD-dependent oxidoreductase [Pirellulaceae bacterium]
MIVGSGHNGLIAANYLAAAGKSVLVLEKQHEFGGATKSQKVFPDYEAYLSRYSYLVSLMPQQIIDELKLDFKTVRRRIASFTPYRDTQGRPQGLLLSNVDPQQSREAVVRMTGSEQDWLDYQSFLRWKPRSRDWFGRRFFRHLQVGSPTLTDLSPLPCVKPGIRLSNDHWGKPSNATFTMTHCVVWS